LLFRGCVMDGLFSHVHDATVRTLGVNGWAVGETPGQVCCGALHAHAGLREEARLLARRTSRRSARATSRSSSTAPGAERC